MSAQHTNERLDVWGQRDELRRLAIEAADRLERLREIVASRDLTTAFDFRADGLLIARLRQEAGST